MALVQSCAPQTSQVTKQIAAKLTSVPMVASAIEMQSASKETALPFAHARMGSLAMALYAVISMNAEMLRCVVSAIFAFIHFIYYTFLLSQTRQSRTFCSIFTGLLKDNVSPCDSVY